MNLHHAQGFMDFCHHELNVELSMEDTSSFTKMFDSPTRIVHLVTFKGMDARNAVYRARGNLGFRSRVWLNEDLIPHKEQLALSARRRFRTGKIIKNWTYQGDVYILHNENSDPLKITCESDFPEGTELAEGEGLLPRANQLRGGPRFNPMARPQGFVPMRPNPHTGNQ